VVRVILLLQTESLTGLRAQETTIRRILGLPGVAGFSLRVPGRTLNPDAGVWDFSTFNHAATISEEFGCELQTRTMGGRWAPDYLLEDPRMHIMTWPGTDPNIKLPPGTEVPLCFTPEGVRNEVWFDWCVRAHRRLARWALPRENVTVQHGFWSGLTWAEIAVVREMENYPGFSYPVIEAFHVDLMTALHEMWPRDVEFALSGHARDYPQIFSKLLGVAKTSPRYVINRNDIGTAPIHEMNFGTIQDPPRHGFQMWGQQAGYDWAKVLDEADGLGSSDGADYLECYPGNFGTATTPSGLVSEVGLPAAGVSEATSGGWKLPPRSVDMIQQLYSPSVASLSTKVRAAMVNTNNLLTGFGTRIPAKYLDSSLSLLDDSVEIADANGLEYRPRTMMGGHISDEVKAAMGSRFLFDGSGAMQGSKIPRPTDGNGNPNTVFLDYYREHVRRVFGWCAANGVTLFNVPTVGMAYSELYFGPEVQNDPDGWLAVHQALVAIVAVEQRPGVTAGWGLSGHGPYFTTTPTHGDMGLALAKGIKAAMPAPDQSEGQGNGWGPNGIWGQSSSSVEAQMNHYLTDTGLVPGAQAIQPWKTGSSGTMGMLTTEQFQQAFAQLDEIDARQLEIYLDTPATDTTKRMVPFLTEFLSS
jgi:hypothetical protein